MEVVDVTTVRRMLLAVQGLLTPVGKTPIRGDVLDAIRRMGVLQIDTINVVARSPYFVLWSRLGAYEINWLDQLLESCDVFEYWSHAACFIPIEDYSLYRPEMEHGHPRYREWLLKHPDVAAHVRSVLNERGTVKSADFKREHPANPGWWGWKPEKTALECLLTIGELMVLRRENFQRVYAPTGQVLNGKVLPPLTQQEAIDEKILRSVKCLGIARADWVSDYFRLRRTGIAQVLDRLSDEGKLLRVGVNGWQTSGFMHPSNEGLLHAVASGHRRPEVTTFLMPFDPVVWDRRRALDLFGFNYKIEVYTPGADRRFGYLTLPILHRDALVGRLDAKAHRKDGRLEVRALHLEEGCSMDDSLVAGVAGALTACAHWHGTPDLHVSAISPLAREVQALLG